jgi:hypothetical protein
MVLATIGGFNNGAGNRNLGYRWTLNGSEVSGSDQSLVAINSAKYWAITGLFAAAAIADTDVIGIKLWGSVTLDLDYRYASLYIIPRTLDTTGAMIQAGATRSLVGAISGVTYSPTASLTQSTSDPDTLAGSTSPLSFGIWVAEGQVLAGHSSLTNIQSGLGSFGSGNVAFLYGPVGVLHKFRKLTW